MRQSKKADALLRYTAAVCGGTSLIFIFLILGTTLVYGFPSIVVNGLKFLTSITWNPALSGSLITVHGFKTLSGAHYGGLVFITGTLVSSALAIIIGAPTAIGVAIFLSEFSPKSLSTIISILVELTAGIPSIIFGYWGLLVLVPFLLYNIEPSLSQKLWFLPFFHGQVYSSGLFASGIILALMIIPIIAAISRDAMRQVPLEQREGAKALGLTHWEVVKSIVLPNAKMAIAGSILLGLGRALGETMAVVLVSGSAINTLPHTAYAPINTIAAFMAQSMDSAFTDPSGMYVSALVELALILLLITTATNILARLLVREGFISSSEKVVRV